MPFTDTVDSAIINWLRGTAMPAPPAGLWIALFTVAPAKAGGGTEVSASGTAYVRKQLTLTAPPSPVSNTAVITWPDATADWGTVVAAALMDAATNGAMYQYGALTPARTVPNGARFSFDPNTFTVSVD